MLGYTGTYKGKRVSVMGSGMGMPTFSIYAHELITEYQVKTLIRVGTCGAFQPDLKIGDVLLAMTASTDSQVNKLRFNGMDPHHLDIWDQGAASKPVGGVRGWTTIPCGQRYPAPANSFPTPKAAIGWMRGHMACLANFLFDIAAGNPGSPGLAQGVTIQKLMDMCRRSAQSGTWVSTEAK